MALQQHPPQNVRMSKCRTNTCHRTRFCSCKIFRKASRKTSSWHSSRSAYLSTPRSPLLAYLVTNILCVAVVRLFTRYPNLYEVRLIPTKKDIAFVEYVDEASATVAKDALHNYKLDGENKIKVSLSLFVSL